MIVPPTKSGWLSWFFSDEEGPLSDDEDESKRDASRSHRSANRHGRRSPPGLAPFQGMKQPSVSARRGFDSSVFQVFGTASSGSGASSRFGWSRQHSRQLARLQGIVRGWIIRRRIGWFPAVSVDAIVIDLEHKDRGIRSFLCYVLFLALFFVAVTDDVAYKHSIETGLADWVQEATFGDRGKTFDEIASLDDVKDFMAALHTYAYFGMEREEPCRTCSAAVLPTLAGFLGPVIVYEDENGIKYNADGTLCPYLCLDNITSSTSSENGGGASNGSNGNETAAGHATTRAAAVANYSGDFGVQYCAACEELAYCFDGTCDDYSQAVQRVEVRGTNLDEVKIANASDCDDFIRFLTTVGVTTLFENDDLRTLLPKGGGFIAEKNRVIGGMLLVWNVPATTPCLEDTFSDFYGTCYSTSDDDRTPLDLNVPYLLNQEISYDPDAGGYPQVFDIGEYDGGLNLGRCAVLQLMASDTAVPRHLGSMSVSFNLYNGNSGTMFAGVRLRADVTLGGHILLTKDITPFPLLQYDWPPESGTFRQVCKAFYLVMLFFYVASDVLSILRRVDLACRAPAPRATASRQNGFISRRLIFARSLSHWDVVVLCGDLSFVLCAGISVYFTVKSQNFEVSTELVAQSATEQVRNTAADLRDFGNLKDAQLLVLVVASIFALLRLFYLARFHRRLSVVTDTIGKGVVHLLHFFLVFFFIVIWYTNIIWVLFGARDARFSSWTGTCMAVLRIGLGEYENYYSSILLYDFTTGSVVIFTYQVLVVILLFNVLVAILIDAYGMVVNEMHAAETDTVYESVVTFLCRLWLKSARHWNGRSKRRNVQLDWWRRSRHRACVGAPSDVDGGGSGSDSSGGSRGDGGVGGGGGGLRTSGRSAVAAPAADGYGSAPLLRGMSKGDAFGQNFAPALKAQVSASGRECAKDADGSDGHGTANLRERAAAADCAAPAADPVAAAAAVTADGRGPTGENWRGRAEAIAEGPPPCAWPLASAAPPPPPWQQGSRRRRVEYFSMRATAEILQASPLPKFAVKRKLRQLIHQQMRGSALLAVPGTASSQGAGGDGRQLEGPHQQMV